MLVHRTTRTVEIINNLKKRLITTSTDKFDIIPLNRRYKAPITINNQILPSKNKGKILGLTFDAYSTTPHITTRTFSTKENLTKIQKSHYTLQT